MRGDPRRSPSLTEAGSGRLRPSRPARGKRRRPAEGTPAPRANERWDPFPTGSLSAGPWMRTPTPSRWLTSGCSLPRCLQTEGHLRAALSFPPDPHSFLPLPSSRSAWWPRAVQPAPLPCRQPRPEEEHACRGAGPGGEVQVPREKDLQPGHGREERPPARASGKTRRQPRPGVILAPGEPAHGFLSPPTSPLTPFGKLHS